MTVLLLEALGALLLLALIVWWTMFSGRDKGELRNRDEHTHTAHTEATQDKSGRPEQSHSAPKDEL